jgi:toxin ParE1/3/4
MRVVTTAQAEADERNPKAAVRVYDAIISQIVSLADVPGRTRHGRVPGARELVISGYPYIVVFELTADEVSILHVNRAPIMAEG